MHAKLMCSGPDTVGLLIRGSSGSGPGLSITVSCWSRRPDLAEDQVAECVHVGVECEFMFAEDVASLDMIYDVPFLTSNWAMFVMCTHPLITGTVRPLSLKCNGSAPYEAAVLRCRDGEPAATP